MRQTQVTSVFGPLAKGQYLGHKRTALIFSYPLYNTKSKITIQNLSNRTRYWFRVHAVNERGPATVRKPAQP